MKQFQREENRVQELLSQFFQFPNEFTTEDFERYISGFLARKVDKKMGLQELDNQIALLSNFALYLSIYFKQKYLVEKDVAVKEEEYYTRKQVAKKFGVHEHTVANWIKDGLKEIEIGGVKRISKKGLEEFQARPSTKKFNWRSPVKHSLNRAA